MIFISTMKLKSGKFCTINICRIILQLKGRLCGKDISIDLWLCVFMLGGRS